MSERRLQPESQNVSGGELGYAPEKARGLRAVVMRIIERMSGLQQIRPKYEVWRKDIAGKSPRMFNIGLDMLGTRLMIQSPEWPATIAADAPLVMVCNHPFGIGDGIAALALAEDLGRPYRVLLNKAFMRVPEVQPFALPIDFDDTREAVETNLRTRNEARRLLKQGVTIIVFPAGGVATAHLPWQRAEELPWKAFAARLIQQAEAAVLPVWFEGQNSAFFHAMSRFGALRMSLLVAEFRRFAGHAQKVHVGAITPFDSLRYGDDRGRLIDELYWLVHRLAPHNAGKQDEELKPTFQQGHAPAWDAPVAKKRRT